MSETDRCSLRCVSLTPVDFVSISMNTESKVPIHTCGIKIEWNVLIYVIKCLSFESWDSSMQIWHPELAEFSGTTKYYEWKTFTKSAVIVTIVVIAMSYREIEMVMLTTGNHFFTCAFYIYHTHLHTPLNLLRDQHWLLSLKISIKFPLKLVRVGGVDWGPARKLKANNCIPLILSCS